MNARFNPTERLGMYKAALAFTTHFSWIFRDQPQVDVGVDAIVERCNNGNPSGEFLAAQVKSGVGNFTVAREQLTLYVSNVHYYYWTSLSLPIVVVAYIPENDICYWQVASEKTLEKTELQWKLVISKQRVLDTTAKSELERAISTFTRERISSGMFQLDFESEFSGSYMHFCETMRSLPRIVGVIEDVGTFTRETVERHAALLAAGHDQFSPNVRGSVKQQARRASTDALRMITEVRIFSQAFPSELKVVEELIRLSGERRDTLPVGLKSEIQEMPNRIESAISAVRVLRQATRLESATFPIINEANQAFGRAADLLISEFEDAKSLILRLQPFVLG